MRYFGDDEGGAPEAPAEGGGEGGGEESAG